MLNDMSKMNIAQVDLNLLKTFEALHDESSASRAALRLGVTQSAISAGLRRLRAVLAPLQVKTDVPAELPLLYVHAALIEQALVNVLENAARFSPAQGRLEVSAGVADDQLFFAVADEGPGIPEDERAKIFDMFYTAARGDRGGQGTGLGLAICQGMVGAHGGRISVAEGIEGRGTCITLFLPLPTQPGLEREA